MDQSVVAYLRCSRMRSMFRLAGPKRHGQDIARNITGRILAPTHRRSFNSQRGGSCDECKSLVIMLYFFFHDGKRSADAADLL